MSTITVELPEELREFIENKVQGGEFSSASEYIVALLSTAQKRKAGIEAALIEGWESGPPQEWTSEEWASITQRVADRHTAG